MTQTCIVRGVWPFPLDMLRYDETAAADAEAQAWIDRLSGENAPDRDALRSPVDIHLVSPGRPLNADRWESFGWKIMADPHPHAPINAGAPPEIVVERDAWRAGLQALTPRGSEFTTPEACRAYAAANREEGVRAKIDRARLSIEVTTLCAQLATAADLLETKGSLDAAAALRREAVRAKEHTLVPTTREPLTPAELLTLAIGIGLTQAAALTAFADRCADEPNADAYIATARQETNDEREIDDDPLLSKGDGGCWVSAWLWVSDEDAGIEVNEEEDDDEKA